MLRWRGGYKLQLHSKILQQKEKGSCAFLSRKSFYFSVQRVAYFAAFWLCIFSFSHLADTHSLCASLTLSTLQAASLSHCIRDPACTPFPTFPSLQLSLPFSPGSAVVNKLIDDHLVPGGSLNTATLFWGKANWWMWTPDVSFRLASKQRRIWGLFSLVTLIQLVWPLALPPFPALLCYFEGLMCLCPMPFSAAFSQISLLGCIINTSECSKIIRCCNTENFVIGLNIGRLKIIPFRLLLIPLRDVLAGEERF